MWRPLRRRTRRRHAQGRTQARLTEHLTEHLERLGSGVLSGDETGPRPAFRARLRDELLAAYARDRDRDDRTPEPTPTAQPAAPARRRHPAMIPQLATFGVALLLTVTGLVAYRSVPGDVLYPLKRGAESTLLRFSTDEVDRAERELHAARERAAEVAALLGSPDRLNLVDETLDDMEKTTRSAISTLERAERPGDQGTKSKMRRFAEEQHDTVAPMLSKMDEEAQRQASGYLNYIEGLAAPD
ncbi:DUF5667 domain-containing protein [Thermocatellispora tengchongensis]